MNWARRRVDCFTWIFWLNLYSNAEMRKLRPKWMSNFQKQKQKALTTIKGGGRELSPGLTPELTLWITVTLNRLFSPFPFVTEGTGETSPRSLLVLRICGSDPWGEPLNHLLSQQYSSNTKLCCISNTCSILGRIRCSPSTQTPYELICIRLPLLEFLCCDKYLSRSEWCILTLFTMMEITSILWKILTYTVFSGL